MQTVKKSFPNLSPAMIDGEKQGSPMNIEEAAGRGDVSKVNPHYGLGGRFEENCQSCVVAYEMRRRGFDIEAKGLNMFGDILSRGVQMAFIDPQTGDVPELKVYTGPDSILEGKAAVDDLAAAIDKLVKTGERWAFTWSWDGVDEWHVVNLDKPRGGKLTLLDTQTGEKAEGPTRFFPDYFAECPAIKNVYLFKTSGMALNPVFTEVMKVADKPITEGQVRSLIRALQRCRTRY